MKSTAKRNTVGDSLLMARVANPSIAAQLQPFAEHNVLNVWGHLSHVLLDSSDFAFPSGMDWAVHSYEQCSYHAWLATHFNDPLARWADRQMAQLLRYHQIVNGDGRFLGDTEANAFYMEAVIARNAAIAWLHHANADFPDGADAAPSDFVVFVVRLPRHQTHRPARAVGFLSMSYGSKIMSLIVPPVVIVGLHERRRADDRLGGGANEHFRRQRALQRHHRAGGGQAGAVLPATVAVAMKSRSQRSGGLE